MNTGAELDPSFQSPGDPLSVALTGLDASRNNFFEVSLSYIKYPSKENLIVFAGTVEKATDQFEEVVRLVVTNEGLSAYEKAILAAAIFKEEDKRRVSFLSKNAKGDYKEFTGVTQESLATEINALLCADYDHAYIVKGLMESFVSGVQCDIDELTSNVGKTRRARFERYGKVAAAHGFDVAKIAVASGIATWLVSKRILSE